MVKRSAPQLPFAPPSVQSAAAVAPSADQRATSQVVTPYVEALTSLASADFALRERLQIEAEQQRLAAEAKRELAAIKDRYAELMVVRIEGKAISFADRLAQIDANIKAFASEKRAEILPPDKKSIELNHGEFGWKFGNDALAAIEGGTPESFGKKLDDLVAKAQGWLLKLKTIFRAGDGKWLKVQLVLDRQAMLAAAKAGQISDAELAKAGLKFAPKTEAFFIKAKAKQVASQPAGDA